MMTNDPQFAARYAEYVKMKDPQYRADKKLLRQQEHERLVQRARLLTVVNTEDMNTTSPNIHVDVENIFATMHATVHQDHTALLRVTVEDFDEQVVPFLVDNCLLGHEWLLYGIRNQTRLCMPVNSSVADAQRWLSGFMQRTAEDAYRDNVKTTLVIADYCYAYDDRQTQPHTTQTWFIDNGHIDRMTLTHNESC